MPNFLHFTKTIHSKKGFTPTCVVNVGRPFNILYCLAHIYEDLKTRKLQNIIMVENQFQKELFNGSKHSVALLVRQKRRHKNLSVVTLHHLWETL